MLLTRYCTAALLCAVLGAATVSGQAQGAAPADGRAEFLVFVGGRQIGQEQVHVAKSGGNWIITATGQLAAPAEISTNRFEMKYTSDWQPLELHVDATLGGKRLTLATSFGMTTAINEITQGGTTNAKTDQISARAIVLPNNFFGAYEAMAARLASATPGTELPVYVAPQAEIKVVVRVVSQEDVKSPAGTIALRKFEMVFQNPDGPLTASVTTDAKNRLARVDIPAAGLSVVRSDLATVSSRPLTSRNPTDTDVTIPVLGFSLAGTITTPPQVAGRLRHPAIVLVAGSGPVDRDANVAGIPIFTQLAGAMAARGFLVLRYDKRAVGQSGGRDERATIEDYAEDVIAAVKWLRKRKDVDPTRVTVAGHSEGGAVGMIAASREDDIASLVLIAAPGTRGSALVLEQQQHGLDLLNATAAERKEKVDIQQRIQTAVLTGVGWEGLPPEYRKAADTPWFRSFLDYDPARVMERIRQPILIVQGDLDKQVVPHHADKLAELARARKRKAPVDVVHLPGLNHLLVPATTGNVAEYPTLKDKKIATEVPAKMASFLNAR
ncbi:MAG: alpha/beta fold hydrolase [Acidobacteria bacterium]|nr:alpha/beta fold hydrolase [Acidobacteriota bacterium]